MDTLKRLIAWAQRNERHLGAVLFVFGFFTDLFTFAFLSVGIVNIAFLAYLAGAALCTFGSHVFSNVSEEAKLWRRTLAVVFPLGAQYVIGSLLSGFLIFYTKSASVIVSWPFLLILALVFIGNEYFRTYYKHLAFQVVLFFFALYAYTIFALPLFLQKLGPWIFLASTALSIIIFWGFVALLARVRRPIVGQSLRYIFPSTALVVVVMTVSYFGGLIPPIPLALSSVGIYHSLQHQDNGYVITTEVERPWWDPRSQIVHHVPGTPLYAFSSVSAPFAFDTSIVHVWEQYDPTAKKWIERTRVAFVISGGRNGGYRGYSLASNPQGGKWRVSIETMNGQVIGRLYFTVIESETPPVVTEEVR